MVHPIFVCIEHKRTIHGSRNTGIHVKFHHQDCSDYLDAEEKGIVVQIGDCEPKHQLWGKCPSPKDRTATEQELELAIKIRDKK